MTVCDPASLGDLPDDGDDLLDRSEYWVYVRDVVKNVCEGNELAFSLSRRGRVSMVRAEGGTKGGEEKTLVHVDPCVHMWMFFDLTGCVKHITCLGEFLDILEVLTSNDCFLNSFIYCSLNHLQVS